MQVIPSTLVLRLTELQELELLVYLISFYVHYGQLNFQSPPVLSPAQCILKTSIMQEDNLPWSLGWELENSVSQSSLFRLLLNSLFQIGVLFAIKTFLTSPFSSWSAFSAILRNHPLSCISASGILGHFTVHPFLTDKLNILVLEFFL